MVATPITASTRHMVRGEGVVYLLTACADVDNPTRAEMNAGVDLTPQLAEVPGWEVESTEIETPDMASLFVDKIGGSLSFSDSSLSFWASRNGVDARSILPRGTEGFVLIMRGGDVPGYKGDCFPIRSRSVGKPVDLGDEAARVNVACSITGEPGEDFTIPAA